MKISADEKNLGSENDSYPVRETYGVIGVCGVVGNLAARVLMDHGYRVTCTDLKDPENCSYLYTLKGYDTQIYFKNHPSSFFNSQTYIVTPPSLSKNSDLFRKIKESGAKIMEADDLLEKIKPDKPVICITGTNGKTTTTSILKHLCYETGFKPTEHGFQTLQGNVDYIPPLQCRLSGDVAVLETGTFGQTGDLKFILKRCQPTSGIITNITPDHLNQEQNFLQYARIKGELVEILQGKKIIVNGDDPTIWGLLESQKYQGEVLTFGVEHQSQGESKKLCWCGNELSIFETISGIGNYNCKCGLERPAPKYLAKNIKDNVFTLQTPNEVMDMEMGIFGLHNVYNALGAIIAAHEIMKIPLKDIKKHLLTFRGVPGRLEYISEVREMDLIVDYAHNPSGVETVLRELSKTYEKLAVVVTVSSESGSKGDTEIMEKTIKYADFIIPASFDSRKAAEKFISTGRIILTNKQPKAFKNGTLGATSKQVIEGLLKGLECDADALVCIGEAAFKYKPDIKNLINGMI